MIEEAGATINITELIDAGKVTRFQVVAVGLCSLVAFLDGLDSQSIAVAAPLIADGLGLARPALGPIFSAALLGGMVGALTFGSLGDRFGRKRCLVAAASIFGVFTLLTAFAQSFEALLAMRFLAGLGLGGATPCFIALASEYAPQRRRAMTASLIWAAFPLGGTAGGFLNGYVLAHHGWQAIFVIGGVLPIGTALLLRLLLPESIRYLLASGDRPDQVRAIVRRMMPALAADARIIVTEERGGEPVAGPALGQLFAEGRAVDTLLLWVPFFMAFGTLAIVVLWTPALLRDSGIAPSQAAVIIAFHGVGSLVGMASAGLLMERFGTTPVLTPALLLGALATGGLGYAATSITALSIVMALSGLFVGMGASGAIALAASTYPTAMRATGIGWAMGMGRLGQVLAPLATSVMLAAGLGTVEVFLAMATAPLIAGVTVFLMRWRPVADQIDPAALNAVSRAAH